MFWVKLSSSHSHVYAEKFSQKYFLFSLLFLSSINTNFRPRTWKLIQNLENKHFFSSSDFGKFSNLTVICLFFCLNVSPLHSGALKHKKYFNTENICENIFIWNFSSSENNSAYNSGKTIKSHQQHFSYLVGIFSSLQIVNGRIANFQINVTRKWNSEIQYKNFIYAAEIVLVSYFKDTSEGRQFEFHYNKTRNYKANL